MDQISHLLWTNTKSQATKVPKCLLSLSHLALTGKGWLAIIWIDRTDDYFLFQWRLFFWLLLTMADFQDLVLTLHLVGDTASLETALLSCALIGCSCQRQNTSSALILTSQVSVPHFLLPGGAFLVWYLIPSKTWSLGKHDFPPTQPSLGCFFLIYGATIPQVTQPHAKAWRCLVSFLSLGLWTSLFSSGSR